MTGVWSADEDPGYPVSNRRPSRQQITRAYRAKRGVLELGQTSHELLRLTSDGLALNESERTNLVGELRLTVLRLALMARWLSDGTSAKSARSMMDSADQLHYLKHSPTLKQTWTHEVIRAVAHEDTSKWFTR